MPPRVALDALARRVADWQLRRAPWLALLAALLVLALGPVARQLQVRSGWSELLPAGAPSVRDLRAGERQVGALSTLTVMLSGPSVSAMQSQAAALIARFERLDPALGVRRVQGNVSDYHQFVAAHRHLYAPLAVLREARDALAARIAWERAQATPGFVSLDDPPEPLDALAARLRGRFESAGAGAARFPGGYFVHPSGAHLAIFLRVDIANGDAPRARAVVTAVEAALAATRVDGVTASLAGDLYVGLIEHDAITRELVVATALTLLLCALTLAALFRRPRALVLLCLALAVPVVATFALARLTVDHLNTSTAFLGSIVIGNGINPGIVWLARYFEARRRGLGQREALADTHRGAAAGTLTASLAAALAYGSLMATDFRGFRDFGVIGATGMALCWALTLLLLPAFVALWERWRPLPAAPARAESNLYGRVVARAVYGAPRAMTALAAVVLVAATALTARAVLGDPLDYNFRNLTSVRAETRRASELNRLAGDTVGRAGSGSAIVVLVQRRDEVSAYRERLETLRERARAPIGPVRSIDDLLPRDQAEKIAVIASLRRLMLEARPHARGALAETLDAYLPPAQVRPLEDRDLPSSVASLYTERDGTRGRIVFVEEAPGAPIWDGRYLIAWAAAVRSVRTPSGAAPWVVGNAPVFADLIEAIMRDGPRAVGLSFLATLALVLVAFRGRRDRALTLGALLFGVATMTGVMALGRLKLNFLNFVALPITFGIGVDYAVNVMRRYVDERDAGHPDPIGAAISETGGAVVACSLTTIFGYSALLTSANRALNSFGLVAVIGEVTCLLAAVIFLAALLVTLERRPRTPP
ncbi:MAG: MMPL family transporter [Myxococcales bacterium]|nr:MMPL family transporter [Myxococcales bacterium]